MEQPINNILTKNLKYFKYSQTLPISILIFNIKIKFSCCYMNYNFWKSPSTQVYNQLVWALQSWHFCRVVITLHLTIHSEYWNYFLEVLFKLSLCLWLCWVSLVLRIENCKMVQYSNKTKCLPLLPGDPSHWNIVAIQLQELYISPFTTCFFSSNWWQRKTIIQGFKL